MGDPDAMEVMSNAVGRNLSCFANLPAVQFGDGGGAPNVVGGFGLGECAFNVTPLNPAAEAGGGSRHRRAHSGQRQAARDLQRGPSRRPRRRHSHSARHNLATPSLPASRTSPSRGPVSRVRAYDPSQPPGASGEAFLATQNPNGRVSFTAFITCVLHLRWTSRLHYHPGLRDIIPQRGHHWDLPDHLGRWLDARITVHTGRVRNILQLR